MATNSAANSVATGATAIHNSSASFERFAGVCAVLAGLAGLLYSLSFVVIARTAPDLGVLLYSLFLLLGGVLTTAVLVGLYGRLREVDGQFALWGVALGLVGAAGSLIHGGYDLANAINPPGTSSLDLPSQVDPRGLLTFGVAGIGLLVISWLITRHSAFPKGLGYLGYVLAAFLVILYLGRLIILDVNNLAVILPALVTGFLLNPAWYVWLGLTLMRARR